MGRGVNAWSLHFVDGFGSAVREEIRLFPADASRHSGLQLIVGVAVVAIAGMTSVERVGVGMPPPDMRT